MALAAEPDNLGRQRCVIGNSLWQLGRHSSKHTKPNATGHIFCSVYGERALLDSRGAATFPGPSLVLQCAWQVCKACITGAHK